MARARRFSIPREGRLGVVVEAGQHKAAELVTDYVSNIRFTPAVPLLLDAPLPRPRTSSDLCGGAERFRTTEPWVPPLLRVSSDPQEVKRSREVIFAGGQEKGVRGGSGRAGARIATSNLQ